MFNKLWELLIVKWVTVFSTYEMKTYAKIQKVLREHQIRYQTDLIHFADPNQRNVLTYTIKVMEKDVDQVTALIRQHTSSAEE